MTSYRPWGTLDWALGLAAAKQWSFLGCLGLEERSVAAVLELHKDKLLSPGNILLLKINDVISQDPVQESQIYQHRLGQCQKVGISPHQKVHGILDPSAQWLDAFDSIKSDKVILDISSMPKRFFFPLLKRVQLDEKVQDLIVCYTSPTAYCVGPLSGNHEDWDIIPGFRTDDPDMQIEANKRLIVNIGFMPQGLIEHLEEDDPEAIAHLIVPFPAQSHTVRRSWAAVKKLLGSPSYPINHKLHRIGPQDMSEAFEKLLSISAHNQFAIALAPFGPKPISAAMCLYAAQTGMPVYYSQPKTYSPSYSSGIGEIFGYWVKHEGQNLYTI
jgi:hypothetical protein